METTNKQDLSYWICYRSQYGREFRVRDWLLSEHYEVYLPLKRTDIRTRRKCRTEVSPLYPPYGFIRVVEGDVDIHPIKKQAKIVNIDGCPAKVTDYLINAIRRKEVNGIHIEKFEYEKGDKVRMDSGVWSGFEGEIVRLSKSEKAIIRILTSGKDVEVYLSDAQPIDA